VKRAVWWLRCVGASGEAEGADGEVAEGGPSRPGPVPGVGRPEVGRAGRFSLTGRTNRPPWSWTCHAVALCATSPVAPKLAAAYPAHQG
jgi:hypothetical protein